MKLSLDKVKYINKEPIERSSPDDDSKKGTETEQRIFYLAVCAFLFSAAAFAVSGVKVTASASHQIVEVDMNQLLRQKAADIVKQQSGQPSESETEFRIAEQARQIRALIDAYAVEHHVIVVSKGAVFGANLKDVTNEISALL